MTKLGNATLFGNIGQLRLRRLRPVAGSPRAVTAAGRRHAARHRRRGAAHEQKLSSSARRNFTGDLLALVAGLFYGGYLIFVERGRMELQPLPLLIPRDCIFDSHAALISIGLGEQIWPHNWTPLLIFAVSSQVIGQGLLVYSIGTLPPVIVGLGAAHAACDFSDGRLARLSRNLEPARLAGAAAIAAALVLVRLPERGLRPAAEPPS